MKRSSQWSRLTCSSRQSKLKPTDELAHSPACILTIPRYDEEVQHLRRELEARGGAAAAARIGGPPQHAGPAQAPPPSIGHGPSNLFGGIMAGQGGQGGPGLAPPPPPQDQPQQGPPQHQMPQPPPGLQQGPPASQQPPFQPSGYPQGPAPNGYGAQPPQSTASPGPGKRGLVRGPGGPATPQLNQQMPYPDPRASPQVGHPTPDHRASQMTTNVGNALAELDLERLPAHQKKVTEDWFAIFNPQVPRILDVDLLHTLPHESVVCCVRFSHDGKYVATGCNRSAQIFDVVTGVKVCHLQDDSVDSVGDLYIRSVCFSPDGRYLATGAEDKLIRVWDIQTRTIRNTFSGHEQDIYSLDFARDGRTIASGSGDRTVRLWDIEASQNILTLSIEDGVTTVAISPDTKFVAAGSLDKSVRVWDIATGYLVERLEGPDGHKDSVYSVAFAPNGKDLVSGSLDKTIKMWELMAPRGGHASSAPKGGRCIKTFEGHKVRNTLHLEYYRHILILFRTSSSQLRSLQTDNGFFPDPRIEEFNSGTQEPAAPSSCYKATRIQSFPLHHHHSAVPLPLVLAT